MITAITPTGDRHLAFALCQRWMSQQTVKPGQWIVIDDGKIPMQPLMPMEYVRRNPGPKPLVLPNNPRLLSPRLRRQHTIAEVQRLKQPKGGWVSIYKNLQAAIPLIRGDKILFIEDDEYYAPTYVETMCKLLDEHELVGIKYSRYYHLGSGGHKIFTSQAHASLAQTAFRSSFLPTFNAFLGHNICGEFLDVRLWTQSYSMPGRTIDRLTTHCRGYLFFDEPPIYVGMKGMPGRGGYGVGHKTQIYRQYDDANRTLLRHWIPEDYKVYLDIISNKLTEANCEPCFPCTI